MHRKIDRHVFSTVLCFFLFSSHVFATETGAITRCLEAINNIRSYDASYYIDYLQFVNYDNPTNHDNTPVVAWTTTNRDVFAYGLGRRIEDSIGNQSFQTISVIDWKTVVACRKPLSQALGRFLPGLTYHDYLNPVIDEKLYLTDLIAAQDSRITTLGKLPNSALIGFQIENPALGGFVHLWVDPGHGYMPRKIEWYERGDRNSFALSERIQIENFAQISDGLWVPSKAMDTKVMETGEFAGRAYWGKAMELNTSGSTWNSINSDELFLAKSLRKVNLEKDGWKCDYAPDLLKAVESAGGNIAPTAASKTVMMMVGAVGVFTALLVAYVLHKRRMALC